MRNGIISFGVNVVKRIVCILIAVLMLLGLLLSFGCAADAGSGSEVCRQFLTYLSQGMYEEAYAMLSDSLKNTTSDTSTRGEALISEKEFREKYEQIFTAIGLESLDYIVTEVSDASITATVGYTMTFHTTLAGELVNNYTVEAVYENRHWGVRWSPALIFPEMQWGDNLMVGVNYPKRGEIFDCEGRLLVSNLAPYTVFCVPSAITDKQAFIDAVMAIPELKPSGATTADFLDVVQKAANSNNSSAVISKLYADTVTDDLESRILAVDGLGVDRSASLTATRFREYPYGTSCSHLLGFATVMHKEDWKVLKDDPTNTVYEKDSWLGYAGLELQYEELLRGSKGAYAYIQGLDGTNRTTLYNVAATDGEDLHLTIDITLQQRVEEVVKTVVYDENITGTVLVMNPTTGAVQAMYSFPDYNAEAFSRGDVGTAEWEALENDLVKTPLLNRAIQGLYAPGSTFKPITAVAGLETGTITGDTLFPASETIKNQMYRTTSGSYKDSWRVQSGSFAYTNIEEINRTGSSNRHTPMNVVNSIIDSDNIFFAWVALSLGWSTFRARLESMGIGEAVPFDLPTQPSQVSKEGTLESYALLAMSGYGQGELLLTPLQMATYISALRNGGNAMSPYVVSSIWASTDDPNIEGADKNGYTATYTHEATVWKTICSQATVDTLMPGLIGVCANEHGGTARYLGVRSFVIAGKTGTAEVGEQKEKELAWFIGFRQSNKDGSALAAEDERLVLVMLELDMNNLPDEATMMKFLIARALLKDDELTEPGVTETCMTNDATSNRDTTPLP